MPNGTRSKELHDLYFEEYSKWKKANCEDCGVGDRYSEDGYMQTRANLTIHHIDENVANNSPENLQTLCRKCHNKKHLPL